MRFVSKSIWLPALALCALSCGGEPEIDSATSSDAVRGTAHSAAKPHAGARIGHQDVDDGQDQTTDVPDPEDSGQCAWPTRLIDLAQVSDPTIVAWGPSDVVVIVYSPLPGSNDVFDVYGIKYTNPSSPSPLFHTHAHRGLPRPDELDRLLCRAGVLDHPPFSVCNPSDGGASGGGSPDGYQNRWRPCRLRAVLDAAAGVYWAIRMSQSVGHVGG